RRRQTTFSRDWSSDVCSSDLDDVASGDTTLRVLSQGGPEWITSAEYADDFPFDIGIAGEQMTVTAVASGMADSFDRTVSNGWGRSEERRVGKEGGPRWRRRGG